MKLFLVHCGFYDSAICDGVYEHHVDFFVAADNFEEARKNAKLIPEFKAKKMHVDGLQEVQAVNGFRVRLEQEKNLGDKTVIVSQRYRDLATKTTTVNPE